ncbi:MAG: LPS-assembly protein LptD [Alphaproteobacteria bacterium]|nr:LPS-assembly protein LptD [Alphaproteobacteria bacterium]
MAFQAGRRARRWASRARSAAAAAALVVLAAGAALAQGRPADPLAQVPILLTANEIAYDQDLDIVTATGNVEIAQNDRVLRADTVSYNRRADVVTASGNVTLLDPSGDVLFASHMEIGGGLRDGIVRDLRMLLADQSRVAAAGARRAGGRVIVMRQTVYSPCELCRDNPGRAPLWQIRAGRTIYDEADNRVYHNDAALDLFGTPVAYIPYIYHPDGRVRRQSGFLAPDFRSSSRLGFGATMPFYIVLGPSADITLAPAFYTRDLPLFGLSYRQRFDNAAVRLNGSVTNGKRYDDNGNVIPGRDTRWHVAGEGRWDIDDDWRAGFALARASDKTYLSRYRLSRRYQLDDTNTLTSAARVERLVDRSYFAADIYAFQGLRPQDDNGLAPMVAPSIQHRWSSGPTFWGSRFSFDSETLNIWRREGTRTNRVTTSAGWTLPHVTDGGQVLTLEGRLLGEFYHADNIGNALEGSRPTEDGSRGRFFPQVALTASWPLLRRAADHRILITPMAQVVAAPHLGDQSRFPNEDSRGVDLDDTSLFRLNRFSGLDRLESGQRVTYGVKVDFARATSPLRFSTFVGQSYRFSQVSDFASGSGLERQLSNVVGRFSVSYRDLAMASYRFQLDGHTATPRRNEVVVVAGPPALRVSASYLFVDKISQPGLTADIAQLSARVDLRLTENWRLQARHVRDIGNANQGALLSGIALIYEDECFILATDVARRNTGTADNPPDTSVIVRLVFRNLGDVAARL